MARDEPGAVVDRRIAAAETLFAEALRVDVHRFVLGEAEARLRARPSFLASTAPQVLVQLRRRLEREAAELVERAGPKLHDLRVFYGVTPADEATEADALRRVLAEVVDVTRKTLRDYFVPGDDKPDDPDDTTVDLAREYSLSYEPSDLVLWAWRQLRGVDTARNQLADAGASAPKPTFELRFFLPEALPPAT